MIENKSSFTKPELDSLGEELIEWLNKDKEKNWNLKDFFLSKNIPFSHTESFFNKSKKFKESFEYGKDVLESKLIKMATDKGYATSGVMFLLKNIVGYKDTQNISQEIIDVSQENLEKIMKKRFKKAELFKSKATNE